MGFKINYKGTACRGTTFLYICPVCAWEQEEVHPASEEPEIQCSGCQSSILQKKPTAVNMDADHHDSMKFHNLGWDEDA